MQPQYAYFMPMGLSTVPQSVTRSNGLTIVMLFRPQYRAAIIVARDDGNVTFTSSWGF